MISYKQKDGESDGRTKAGPARRAPADGTAIFLLSWLQNELKDIQQEIRDLRLELRAVESSLRLESKAKTASLCLEMTRLRLEIELKLNGLQGWIIATLLAVALSTVGLVVFPLISAFETAF